MTVKTSTAVLDHGTDAGFRAWGSELRALILAAGMIRTADTGQIDWATAVRAAANGSSGYEIWTLPDSSLWIKLEYGTGGAVNYPRLYVTVGQGSNGAGTLTGQLSTRFGIVADAVPISIVTGYTSYCVVTNDCFILQWKHGAQGSSVYPQGQVVIGKTVDDTGVATSDGFGVLRHNGAASPGLQCVRVNGVALPTTYTETSYISVFPGNPTSGVAGNDVQVYQIWMNMPEVRPFAWAFAYLSGDIPSLTSVSLALVGATPRTYLALGQRVSGGAMNGQVNGTFGILFE